MGTLGTFQKRLPRVIAICGLKRSGKDTIADFLCHEYGYEKIKIASPLKNAIKHLFNLSEEQIEGHEKDTIDSRWGVEPRKLMQFFGTEIMQYKVQEILPDIGRHFWIRRLIEEHIDNTKLLVIPDLRFKHEYDILKKYDVEFWRVERHFDISSMTHDNHSSELEYLDIPVCKVFENKCVDNLYSDVKNYLSNCTNQIV
jgi:hypothetical protein